MQDRYHRVAPDMSEDNSDPDAGRHIPVVIYARYSSDMQNDRSIEDQLAACRAALRAHERVVHVFEDRARSGAFMAGRPGIQALLQHVRSETCKLILTESLDRLSRSLEDVAHIYRLARFHGVTIRTLMEDEISEMHICFNGAMASVQLQQTVERTRRGQIGNIRAGKAGGGLAYGYRVRYLNDAGEPEPGLREIDPVQAEVVRSVYEDYAAGISALRIAARLNAEGVPTARGGKWRVATLTGHYNRKDGILQNPIYRGLLVWGRCPETRHPESGKRQIRVEADSNWVTQSAPHLRIIDDELWFKAQEMRRLRRKKRGAIKGLSPFDLAARCARCGGPQKRIEEPYLICRTRIESRTCSANRRYAIAEVTDLLYDRLRLLKQAEWQVWVDACAAAHERIRTERIALEGRIADANAGLDRLVEALADGLTTSAKVKERIRKLEQTVETLTGEHLALDTCPHPSMLDRPAFLAAIRLADNSADRKRRLVTKVISSIVLDRTAAGDIVITEIEPDYPGIAALAGDTMDWSGNRD